MNVEKFYYDDEGNFYTHIEHEFGLDLSHMSLDERESFLKDVALKGEEFTQDGIFVARGQFKDVRWLIVEDLSEETLYVITNKGGEI